MGIAKDLMSLSEELMIKEEIKVSSPTELRDRDKKRSRILLTIGTSSWHLTQDEARKLVSEIKKYLV